MAHVGIPWRVALINEFMRKLIELGAAGQAMTVFRQVALENAIAAIAKEVNVDPEQIKPDTSIENSGADSLGSVELESALDLPTGFIKKTTTVNDIADRMAAQLAGQKTASESKAGGDIE
jgi:acyl carrier protein